MSLNITISAMTLLKAILDADSYSIFLGYAKDDLVSLLTITCAEGDLAGARFVYDMGLTFSDIKPKNSDNLIVIKSACISQNIDVIKWVYSLGYTPKELGKPPVHLRKSKDDISGSVLATITETGNIKIFKWYISLYSNVSRYMKYTGLRIACARGHVELTKFIMTLGCNSVTNHAMKSGLRYELDSKFDFEYYTNDRCLGELFHRRYNNFPLLHRTFIYQCAFGTARTAECIYSLGLNISVVRAHDNAATHAAIHFKNFGVLWWLHSIGITKSDIDPDWDITSHGLEIINSWH